MNIESEAEIEHLHFGFCVHEIKLTMFESGSKLNRFTLFHFNSIDEVGVANTIFDKKNKNWSKGTTILGYNTGYR